MPQKCKTATSNKSTAFLKSTTVVSDMPHILLSVLVLLQLSECPGGMYNFSVYLFIY